MNARCSTQCAVTHEPFPLALRLSAYMAEPQWRRVADALCLTGRKLEVARALFDGLDEAAVAKRLSISRHSVHNHIRHLYRLLGVHSRNELFHRIAATHLEINHDDGRPNQETEKTLSEKTIPKSALTTPAEPSPDRIIPHKVARP